ncbi:MAG TPA: hypothetical protein PLO78_06490 [Candidatus Omnitrophota bacterium]|nr:hypothetical protein [Candidatus Omnitrophota bacterium]
MAIIPKELNLTEICHRLQVTAAWVGKALIKLKMERKGRGKQRLFTLEELRILNNVKLLRLCGISWSQLYEARRREERTRHEIQIYFKTITKDDFSIDEEKGHQMVIPFALTESYSFCSSSIFYEGGGSVKEKEILSKIKMIASKHELADVVQEMVSRGQSFEVQMRDLHKSAASLYKPIPKK